MEKRRVRLDINGVVCGLITEESDEYMQALADEVGIMMLEIMAASPFVTREAAALTVALNFCDEAKKNEETALRRRKKLKDIEKRALEVERASAEMKKENAQLWEETEALLNQPGNILDLEEKRRLEKRIAELEAELEQIKASGGEEPGAEKKPHINKSMKNPLRSNEYEQQGFVSFFEKDADE